jgi:hypothetical protein
MECRIMLNLKVDLVNMTSYQPDYSRYPEHVPIYRKYSGVFPGGGGAAMNPNSITIIKGYLPWNPIQMAVQNIERSLKP